MKKIVLHTGIVVTAILAASSRVATGQTACFASTASLTPTSWHAPASVAAIQPQPGLRLVREIPLPGPANRFDYQSVDPASGRIYMNHMNAGRTIVFDANLQKIVAEVMDVPRATGVLAVPRHHQVYVSAAGNHEVAIFDDRTLKITARVRESASRTASATPPVPTRSSCPTNRARRTWSSIRTASPGEPRSGSAARRGTRTTTRCRAAL